MPTTRPLRIALLAYRGKPHVGGQGVYVRHLSKALADLGHHVEVLGGQPYPVLDERVPLVELPSLDIYNDHFPMRMPGLWELKHWHGLRRGRLVLVRPVPRAARLQPAGLVAPARPHAATSTSCTTTSASGYGLLGIERDGPAGAGHHPPPDHRRPPARDRARRRAGTSGSRCAAGTRSPTCRPGWPSGCARVITVSENSFNDIVRDHEVDPQPHGDRAGRRRRRPVPAAARRRAGARAASSPPPAPT